jgi:hypothetical protein
VLALVGGLKTSGIAGTLTPANSTGGKYIIHIKHGLSIPNITKHSSFVGCFLTVFGENSQGRSPTVREGVRERMKEEGRRMK